MIYMHRLHQDKDKQSVDMFHDMYSNRGNKEEKVLIKKTSSSINLQ